MFINKLKAPPSTQPTSESFTITIYNGSYLVDSVTTNLTYTANKALMGNTIITPANTGVSEVTTYKFVIKPANPLLQTGFIKSKISKNFKKNY